jgi:two-component SAPR family response regulator
LVPDKDCLDITGDFTLELWLYTPEPNIYAHIFSKHQPGINDDGSWVLKLYESPNGETFAFSWPYVPNVVQFEYKHEISDLGWFHFAVCYDDRNDSISFWLNGDRVATEKVDIKIRNTKWPLYIGSEGSYNFFKGYIREIRFSNIVRYRHSFRPPPGYIPDDFTIAYWPCNEGRSDVLHDLSKYENHGRLENVSWISVEPETNKMKSYFWLFVLLLVIISVTILLLLKRNKRVLIQSPATIEEQLLTEQSHCAGISLFGGFRAVNSQGEDITNKFSPLPRQLLIFILLHSIGSRLSRGVPSERLMNTFWPDSNYEKAKNAMGTALNKLRKLLHEIDDCRLVNKNHLYRIKCQSSDSCDYLKYTLVKQSLLNNANQKSDKTLSQFLEIVGKGTLLPEMDSEWLDPFKASVTNDVVKICLSKAKEYQNDNNTELLLKLSTAILTWDALNEEALKIKIKALTKLGRHGAAKETFERFQKEYFDLFEEETNLNFHDLISI